MLDVLFFLIRYFVYGDFGECTEATSIGQIKNIAEPRGKDTFFDGLHDQNQNSRQKMVIFFFKFYIFSFISKNV